jgi:uncharacterized protein YndB with AHSA1/START domain
VSVAPVRKQLRVRAAQARAFDVFTREMSAWWPPTHTILKSPLKDTIIEPHAGGRWYVTGEDGSSCQTGYVITWQPPELLVLAWQLNADWQFDPELVTEVQVRFVAESDQVTRVELEHRYLERMGRKADDARTTIDSPGGWGGILERYRRYIDS